MLYFACQTDTLSPQLRLNSELVHNLILDLPRQGQACPEAEENTTRSLGSRFLYREPLHRFLQSDFSETIPKELSVLTPSHYQRHHDLDNKLSLSCCH